MTAGHGGARRGRARIAALASAVIALCGMATVGAQASSAAPRSAYTRSAYTQPAYTWSKGVTVPGAVTPSSDGPFVGGCPGCQITVMWRRASDNDVVWKTSLTSNPAGSWQSTTAIPGARTNASPSVLGYYDPLGNYGPFVVFKGETSTHLCYTENTIGTWTRVAHLPGAATSYAPAAFFPYFLYTMLVVWTGPNGDIYYSYGTPATVDAVDSFTWTTPATIPKAHTNAAPAVAEIQTNVDMGRIYVFWKGYSGDRVWYSWTADPHLAHSGWSAEKALTNGAPRTSAAPSAVNEGSTTDAVGTLMVAYRGQHNSSVYYESMNADGTWGSQHSAPGVSTSAGPDLGQGYLAVTTSSGKIVLYKF
jgi:hypothetical protein